MRITCVIGTLGGGGAERVMTYLCGGLAARGHEVTLLTLDDSVPDFYSVPDGVRRVTYENGDQIVVDYHQKKAYLNGKQILPLE